MSKIIDDLKANIEKAGTLRAINKIREVVVENMAGDNGLLEAWQKKYWSLKICPTCGKEK